MTVKKRARKKPKTLRQSWRDLVSWWTGQKKASAARAKQKVKDAKDRDKAAKDRAAAKAEAAKLAAEKKAARDAAKAAAKAQAQAEATVRAQQRAAERQAAGRPVTGTVVAPVASLCGQPLPENPRERCGHLVLPGTPACAAGHPQGGSSFGGRRRTA